jgi:polysaccharide pyruvyl transferase WcaK-like protein
LIRRRSCLIYREPIQGASKENWLMSAAELDIGADQRGKRPHAEAVRVALFGGFGIGNFGNDASLEATVNFLRTEYPDAVLSSICSAPGLTADKFGLPTYPTSKAPSGLLRLIDIALLRTPRTIWNWIYTLGLLKRFDTVLVAGTGVFDDYRDSPFGWPSRLLRWSLAARLRGVRLVFLSVGAGPIVNPISRLLMKISARLAAHRSYRDAESRTFMQSIGMDETNSPILPDLAFLLPAPHVQRDPGAPLTVGVGLMNYRGWRDSDAVFDSYVATHVRLIQWIEAQGHKVRILIGQTPVDLKAVRAVEGGLGRTLMTPEQENMNCFQDAMAAAAETDVVVASRYHVQIATLKVGRPLISLSYAPKNDSLLAEAGLGGFVQPVEQLDFDKLTAQIDTLLKEREHYGAIVRERVAELETKLKRAIIDMNLLALA